jgi:hypothetical protein
MPIKMLVPIVFAFINVMFCGINAQASPQNSEKPTVIGWIPAYGMEQSIEAMESNSDIGKTITRIGLQLWNPSADGKGVVFAPINKEGQLVKESDVRRLVAWAKERNIKVLLTVYNNSQVIGKWDWELAKNAFANNAEVFSKALIAEMQRFNLDGIDLDLEGEGHLDKDRTAYARFVGGLSAKLKKQKKLLTIDSFHSPCANAPNMTWWADWQGKIDAIHSMGYQDLYEGSTESFTPEGKTVCEKGAAIFKYSWQLQYGIKAGYQKHQIIIGMPTWLDKWGKGGLGKDPISHIKEVKKLGLGIALWDLQLEGKQWRNGATWKEMQNENGKQRKNNDK